MNFFSEGVIWTLPFSLPMTTSAEEPDVVLLQAVYGSSYEPVHALNEREVTQSAQWLH
jgi:hypothetical protein